MSNKIDEAYHAGVLGIAIGVDELNWENIRDAYKSQMRIYHPDSGKFPNLNKAQAINAAYAFFEMNKKAYVAGTEQPKKRSYKKLFRKIEVIVDNDHIIESGHMESINIIIGKCGMLHPNYPRVKVVVYKKHVQVTYYLPNKHKPAVVYNFNAGQNNVVVDGLSIGYDIGAK